MRTPPAPGEPPTHGGASDSMETTRLMTYHELQTAWQPRSPHRARWRTHAGVALLIAGISGCVESRAELGLVAFDADRAGTKMLRPGAQSRACATRVLGIATGDGASPLDRALQQLRAIDAEADALTRVAIDTHTLALGVFDRTCVTVHADVVRQTSLVRLPAPPGHEGHH
jgi:hypothetical protein